jgi:microcin C transport system permease protein
MRLPRVTFSPVAKKRFLRFRKKRLARWSLWLLISLYALSLGAELVANSRPLVLVYEGGLYFPAFFYYPEDTFYHNGRKTRPNYRALADSPDFRKNPKNLALFPPVAFDPYESVPPESIPLPDIVETVFTPARRVASLDITPEGKIARAAGAKDFFGVPDHEAAGLDFNARYTLDPETALALRARFANAAAPELAGKALGADGEKVTVRLAEYRPRANPPKTARIRLEDPGDQGAQSRPSRVFLNREGAVVRGDAEFFGLLEAGDRARVEEAAKLRFSGHAEPFTVSVQGRAFRAVFEKTEVRFPYPPCPGHLMGLDGSGRDVFARILYATRTSITFGFVLTIAAMVLGTWAGALQGYYGGAADIAGQRVIEIWSAIPFLYVMIFLGSVYGRGFLLLLICYAIFNWIGISYYMRAEFLRLRKMTFVEAAKVLGIPTRKILVRHILPNALVPVITFFPFYLVGAIGSLAALDYLGFGLPPPTPSWGELLAQAQAYTWAWWLILYPSLALFFVMLMGVFIGEGARNAYDPKPHGRLE